VRSASRAIRRGLLLCVLLGCLIAGVLPALAADTTVTTVGTSWQPAEFAVMPGDVVTWRNPSTVTAHNLHIDGTLVQADGMDWTYTNTFPARDQAYEFHCSLHLGMSGRFYVNAAGAVPTPSPSATATPTSSPPSTGGAATPAPSPDAGAPVAGSVVVTRFAVRPARDHFCTRRSRTCKRPGVILVLDLGASDRVRVRGTLRRRPLRGGALRRFGPVAFTLTPGRRRMALPSRRRITPGRYQLELKAGGLTRRVRFLVRPS
jgi:plastocyanin